MIVGTNETDGHPMITFPPNHPEIKQAWDGAWAEDGALLMTYGWHVSGDVRDWLEENVPAGRWQALATAEDARIVFLDEADLIAFRLRWS
jgi:hypothetical protein